MAAGDPGDGAGALGACPVPLGRYERVVMGHGGGGQLSLDLLREVFLAELGNEVLARLEDQATLPVAGGRIAVTTDAFVVRPMFFPGGDIGSLSVHGTVNDLAMGGAEPRYLTAAFVLEEGTEISVLRRVVRSMARACEAAGVALVAGDTKVVERGKGDGVYVTTTGVGIVPPGVDLSVRNARPGDTVLLSGSVGDHGVAVLSVRDALGFETELLSDSAPLHTLARAVLEAAPGAGRVRCMRDPTRGGVASAVNEIASASGVGIALREAAVPVKPAVRAACEILGLDPLYVANEGKLLAVVAREDAPRVLEAMRAHPLGRDAAVVGEIVAEHAGKVTVASPTGGRRALPLLAGEMLPRIC